MKVEKYFFKEKENMMKIEIEEICYEKSKCRTKVRD